MMKRKSNYDKEPHIDVKGYNQEAWYGYKSILNEITSRIEQLGKDKVVVTIDYYHGVLNSEVKPIFKGGLSPALMIDASEANHSDTYINDMLKRNITDDRVFGVLSCHQITEFFVNDKILELREKINKVSKGIVLICGIGAALIAEPDILIYADMARWEIQKRFRREEISNWCTDNYKEEFLRKYKRAFFVDWRVLDKHKASLFDKMDYLLDTNMKGMPKMATAGAIFAGLDQALTQPFRVVPFFDPGPWGGQWMKDVCDLDKSTKNFAWCFDCVPEENSLYLKFGSLVIEIPSINLMFYDPVKLLGNKVHARFGSEFPIRFDFLDTMDGGNLSLQVHPLTEYIQQTFGMHYTQDESYYILDAGDDAVVYLGLKEGVNSEKMTEDLEKAQEGDIIFDVDQYINQFKAKKHDHYLIPAGTVHCSGKNSMVLEISATPYIFTFKLWDWGRVGLDGKPRPIHVAHGKNVIQWDRDTAWTVNNLVNRVVLIDQGEGWTEEKTGLHEREFIETRRHWFTMPVCHTTMGSVNVLNLIEGEEAIVESPDNQFEPFEVHYAETFIIPAAVKEYVIRPKDMESPVRLGTIKAYVRC